MRAFRGGLLVPIAALSGAIGCGSTYGPVLELIEPREPPRWRVRADALLVNDVTSCAIGRACQRSPDACFALSGMDTALYFEPNGLTFVEPDDPRLEQAEQSGCFRLTLDANARGSAAQALNDLRAEVFRLSGGTLDLDLRLHDLPPIPAGFKRWENGRGIFLEPSALENEGLTRVGADTDYVFAISGETDPDLGFSPTIEPCAGTNWQEQGGFGGAAYTWLSLRCATSQQLLWHFLHQTYFALRDVMYFDNLYAGRYPGCGEGEQDAQRWFPRPDDCVVDPDFASCGDARCRSTEAFEAHLFSAHWPQQQPLVGNHCRNGVQDFDEASVDAGGVCERLGR